MQRTVKIAPLPLSQVSITFLISETFSITHSWIHSIFYSFGFFWKDLTELNHQIFMVLLPMHEMWNVHHQKNGVMNIRCDFFMLHLWAVCQKMPVAAVNYYCNPSTFFFPFPSRIQLPMNNNTLGIAMFREETFFCLASAPWEAFCRIGNSSSRSVCVLDLR